MRALVVTNMYPTPERPWSGPFVRDQVEALRRRGDVEVELFHFAAGTRNYPRAARELRRRYDADQFDVVHVHFGLVAWPALLAGLRPLVVTLHGNDLLHPRSKPFTRAALPLIDAARRGLARVQREHPGRRPDAPRGDPPLRRRPHALPPDPARGGARAARTRPRRPVPAVPARHVAAAEALRPRAGGRRRRARCSRSAACPRRRCPYWINAANAVIVPSQDEGMGLAVIEASACDVPAFGTPVGAHAVALAGIEGSACLEWDRGPLARGARAAPRGGGPAGRRPPRRGALLGRPDGRAGGRRVAGAAGRARLAATYTRSDGTSRAFRTFMSGLLRRIRRPGAAEETRTEPTAAPDPAHGSAPEVPPRARTGSACPRAPRPRTSSAARSPAAAASCAAAPASCAAPASSPCATSAASSTRPGAASRTPASSPRRRSRS